MLVITNIMLKFINISLTTSFLFLIFSCAGNLEKDIAEYDRFYGYCDNPHREITGPAYDTCKAKERALGANGTAGEFKPFSITDLLSGKNNTVAVSNTNKFLWQASLNIMSNYELRIADNSGGYIQTEWIIDPAIKEQRCMIKIQIVSPELVSNGVKTNFLCEKLENEKWAKLNKNFIEEEKQLTLKILSTAQTISSETL